jgi:predicted extracellular nuclease
MLSMSRRNIVFGNDQVLKGTFEKFHAQNIVFHSDSTVKLCENSSKTINSLEIGSSSENPSDMTYLVIADKFKGRSDIRLKSDIRDLQNCIGIVTQLEGKQYKFKNTDKVSYGMIAQDVQKILPELVSEDDDGYLNISYIEVIPLLVESIKELSCRLDMLERRINK